MDSRPRTPNEQLLYQRKMRGWSQKRLGDEINAPEKRVAVWERGESTPSPHYQEKLCLLFGKDAEELGFSRAHNPETPIPATIQESNNMEERLDNTETILDLCWEAWFASRPARAVQEILKILPRLYRMRLESISLLHHLRAQEMAIRCHGLLGLVYLDAMSNDMAFYHFDNARLIANEIHDLDQSATYLALIGTVLRRKGDKLAAISHMELALNQAARAQRTTQGYILQFLAYAYADTGNVHNFERTISEATDLLSHTGEGTDAVLHEFIPFVIYMLQGKANRTVGRPMNAMASLELAEKSLVGKPVVPRWQALIQISRAQLLCDAGDLATGIELAKQGFLLASRCQSPRQMNRVKKLMRELEGSPHKDNPKVGELKEVLYQIYVCGG